MTLDRVNLPALVALWARGVDALVRAAESPDAGGPDAGGPDADQPGDGELVAVRHEIAQRLRRRPASAETRDLLREFDDMFRAATTESGGCVFGEDAAASAGWTRAREWYFWRTRRPMGAPSDGADGPH